MDKKDFLNWTTQKEHIEQNMPETLAFSEGQIWWCSLGINVGSEQDGKNRFERPVLVVKKFNNRMCWAIPITSKTKSGDHHLTLNTHEGGGTLILSQMRLISVKRFLRVIAKMTDNRLAYTKTRLIFLLQAKTPS